MNIRQVKVSSMMWMFRVLALLAIILAATASPPAVRAGTTIPVNTTADTVDDLGDCSLREAIQAANTDHAVDGCPAGLGTDTITFHIGADGSSQIITLGSALAITTPVTLDGTTQQAVYAGIPLIHITRNGTGLIDLYNDADGSIIRGLKFSQVRLESPGGHELYLEGDGYQIKGCYFNTDGTATLGNNNVGITFGVSSNSAVGGPDAPDRNLFGGHTGIDMGPGTGNTIQGNYFGVNTGGSTALTGTYGGGAAINIAPGSVASTPSSNNTIRGNVIGGYSYGIVLQSPSEANTIVGNYIGVGANGSTAIGNGVGIYIEGSSNNTIGGTTAADRNVISASSGGGGANILLNTAIGPVTPAGNTIQGNYIGTTADGMTGLSPTVPGIDLLAGSNTVIGGTAIGAGNVISGNNNGIHLDTGITGTIIRGNKIGTNPSGTVAVPNSHGISSLSAVDIGNSVTPGNNIIAGNSSGVGITLASTSGSTVYGNRIGVNAASTSLPNQDGVWLSDASATFGANWIGFNTLNGIYLAGTSTVSSDSTLNCFNGNGVYAVRNDNTGYEAPFTQNWWGNDTGPSGSGPGTGDPVTNHVTFSPYLTLPAAACHIFADVPVAGKEWMEPWVDAFYLHGITTGCGANPLIYCPENSVTRAAMAVFILRTIEGPTYTPPAAHGYFDDLPVTGKEWMEPWVDEFYDRGITTGCGTSPLRYCPENPVTRAAMAVFLLRALEGSSYVPDHTDHYFSDLPVTGKAWMEPFVDEFYTRQITTGCGTSPLRYCPENPVTRAAMAVFISRAYGLYP